jgi:hypothetical protein
VSAGPDVESRALDAVLAGWIAAAPAGFVRDGAHRAERWGLDAEAAAALESGFETLALQLFAYQFERVPVYRAWSLGVGASPSRVRRAADVPALPVEAWARTRVAAFPAARDRLVFHTSGTTGGAAPGRLHLDDAGLYELALERDFRHHVLPDRDRMRMLQIVPAWSEAPHSSLAYMLEHVRWRCGAEGSAVLAHGDRLEWPALQAALRQACAACEPVCLLGTAFAWVHVLELCEAEGFAVRLPAGSRLFETGGFKGRSRELSRAALTGAVERWLGLPATHVVGEYGMTELGSQYYTLGLRRAVLGEPAGAAPDGSWSFPAWLRPRLVDSESGACRTPEAACDLGLLVHHDLANRGSVAHLATADLGAARGCSFELVGRSPRADLRGCGLAQEDWSAP